MEARLPRIASLTAVLVIVLGVAAPAPGAEVRFTSAVYTTPESASALAVELELTAPECSGEARISESAVVVTAGAGGARPATPGADFTALAAVVPLGVSGVPPIRYGRTLRGLVLDDGAFDGFEPETFLLAIALDDGAVVECDDTKLPLDAGAPAVVEIVDDEAAPEIAFSRARDTVPEDAGARVYSLVRGGAATGEVTATILSSSRRVTVEPAELSWGATESGARDFTVVVADGDAQGDERVVLTLELTGAVAGAPESLVLTLVDDDESLVSFAACTRRIREGEEGTCALRREGASGAVRATLRAAPPGGVELDPPVVSWADGESGERSFTVRVADDARRRENRTVTLRFDLEGEAARGTPDEAEITIVDDDATARLVIVSGDDQRGPVDTVLPQPFVLRVINADEDGVAGVEVTWTVEGEGTLLDGGTTRTDGDGRTSNQLRLGATPGPVRVLATANGQVAVFDADADAVLGRGVRDALLRACTENGRIDEQSLDEVCGYFFNLPTDGLQEEVIEQIRPEEVAAQANTSQDAARVQLGNVGARLAALRNGAGGTSIQQLMINVGGTRLSPHALATALRPRAAVFDPEAAVDQALAAGAGAQDDDPPPVSDEIDAPGRLSVYVNGSLAFGDRRQTTLETGFDFDTLGLTAGIDYRLRPSFFVGGALGYKNTETDLAGDGGTLDSDGLSLSLYLMRYWDGGLYLQGVVDHGENDHDLVRHIDLPTSFRGKRRYSARGETEGRQTSLAVELGFDASLGAWSLVGFGRASRVDTDIDRYRETGDPDGSGFYLEVFDQEIESLLGEAGVQATYAASYSWGVLFPQARVSLLHEFEDDRRQVLARFIEDDDPTNVFAIPTDEPDRDYLNLGVGVSAQLPHGISAFLFYDTDLDRDDLDVSKLSVGVRFEL